MTHHPAELPHIQWFHVGEGKALVEFEVAIHDASKLDPDASQQEVIVTLRARGFDPPTVAVARTTRDQSNAVRDRILNSLDLTPGCFITLSGVVPPDPSTIEDLEAAGHTVRNEDFFAPWQRSRDLALEAIAEGYV